MASVAPSQDRNLIVAIHDVCPATLDACRGLTALVEQSLPDVPLTLLIIPDYRGQHRIDQAAEFRGWVDARIERGDEVVLHGLWHFDDGPPPRTPAAWVRRRVLTDGEAEFATLSAGQARRRIARGLELIRVGRYYDAHEVLEDAWRAAAPAERDFFQGLVHVAVAWYQAGRGNEVGCERQLEKAARRLGPYAPAHRGLDVEALLASVDAARGALPDLPPPVLRGA